MAQKSFKKPFIIRDPVHGYLAVAVHERSVVDHPITQRLRRVRQTGLAEYVFPEGATSRFVHSLGAMHMASRFLIAALENAEEGVALGFFDEIDVLIPKLGSARSGVNELFAQQGTLSALLTPRAAFSYQSLQKPEVRTTLAFVEAGLRLAALFHDLGHLPLSHDVEYAFHDYAAMKKTEGAQLGPGLKKFASVAAPHEEIGHKLAQVTLEGLRDEASDPIQTAFEIAIKILEVDSPSVDLRHQRASALQWVHSLIDGEVDADRADYLLRDGEALGLDFAHYDVDRLVAHLVLVNDPSLGYVSAIKEPGLAALESFCLSRSRSNQVFIRHHKVAQTASALRHASVAAFDTDFALPLIKFLDELANGNSFRKDFEDEYASYDDGWWFQALRMLRKQGTTSLTRACLDAVIDRSDSLTSVWKRYGDLTKEQVEQLNQRIDDLFETGGRIGLASKRKNLTDRGILISPFKFKPYAERQPTMESVMLVKRKSGVVPASEASSIIANTKQSWVKDVHVYAFVEKANSLSLNHVVNAILEP